MREKEKGKEGTSALESPQVSKSWQKETAHMCNLGETIRKEWNWHLVMLYNKCIFKCPVLVPATLHQTKQPHCVPNTRQLEKVLLPLHKHI